MGSGLNHPLYQYDDTEAVIARIRKQVRAEKFSEAAQLCEHLKTMLQAKRALQLDEVR